MSDNSETPEPEVCITVDSMLNDPVHRVISERSRAERELSKRMVERALFPEIIDAEV